jgi:diguanylate cyclase (GGDEF)-like protein
MFPPGLAKMYRGELEKFIETGVTRTFECGMEEMGVDAQYDIRFTWINEEIILVVTRDITERNRSKKRLYELGTMDSLTGVYNRNFFEREISSMSKGKGNFAVMVCDVDALKLFNDIMGHMSGDEYLKTTAGVLKKNIPEEAVLARVGGDEFAVIFKNATLAELEKIKQNIKIDLKKVRGDYQFVPTGLSIGYALRNLNGDDIKELYRFADDEMYREKTNHRYTRSTGDISLLTKMLEARNFETEAHASRLEKYCSDIGRKLDFPEGRMNSLSLFAKFHDIGKIGIKDSILLKPGKLTDEEFEEMKKHTTYGRDAIAVTEKELGDTGSFLRFAQDIAYSHQEK